VRAVLLSTGSCHCETKLETILRYFIAKKQQNSTICLIEVLHLSDPYLFYFSLLGEFSFLLIGRFHKFTLRLDKEKPLITKGL
jgi:hypothetical protein